MVPRRLVRRLPVLVEFLHQEATAGLVLVAATVVALVWANSPAGDGYATFWHQELTIGRGWWAVTEDLQHWINDGLMAVFFFVVGLEIKRELVTGELTERRAAVLPVVAALGGVVLPAFIFLVVAPGGAAARGWGVPMATDIAFAIGILALFAARAGAGAKLLLLAIAIVDDIIAIVIIAAFYSGPVRWGWLALAVLGLLVTAAMAVRVSSPWAYVPLALVIWFAVLESGIHATIAGVALGLMTPAHPVRGKPVLEELERGLHPLSAYLVVPLFALANAGVDLRGGVLGDAAGERLTWAVALGLVIGKTIGIGAATLGARRLGVGELPGGMPPTQIWPVAALGGIGFTVALFIADLAFIDPVLVTQAKVGIFLGSIAAAVLGAALLFTIRSLDKLPEDL
jgi:NhaA family Na+:H+ antiporter